MWFIYRLILVGAVIFSRQAFANIAFDIAVTQTSITKASNEQASKAEEQGQAETETQIQQYQLHVEIGSNYFSYTKENHQYIYDFSKQRIYNLDLTAKVYSDDSLFSVVGYKVFEFRNRIKLNEVLAKAAVNNDVLAPVYSEHLFSLTNDAATSALDNNQDSDFIRFSHQSKELLAYSKKNHKLDNDDFAVFMKFFTYIYGGHPRALTHLQQAKYLPQAIEINQYNIAEQRYQLAISAPVKVARKNYSLASFKLGVIGHDDSELIQHLITVSADKLAVTDEYLAKMIGQAEQSVDAGNMLAAMLSYFEYNLVSGRALPESFMKNKEQIARDKSVRLLFSSLQAKDQHNAKDNIIALKTLMTLAGDRQTVLKVFLANNYLVVRNSSKAQQLFTEVIKVNPYLVGAYKDLGGIYFDLFNTAMAWRCWDLARQLMPEHSMLIHINNLEKQLKERNPQFF
ncbi:MAG: hypothetical protein ACSHW0_04475 [Thalassotalea sp.]